MSGGEIDAVGSLVTGALVAGQFDKQSAGTGEITPNCLNCGAPITGDFCSQCGQRAHISRSIGHIFHDLMHGLLHFDSKAWRTLPMLFFRPGRLTREYVEGKRARYVAPFAMFLFTVFVMYFTFAFVGGEHVDLDSAIIVDPQDAADLRNELDQAQADLDRLVARQAEIAAKPVKAPGEGAGLSGEMAGKRVQIAALRAALQRAAAVKAGKPAPAKTDEVPAADSTRTLGEELVAAAKSEGLDVNLGNPELNARVRAALKNPDLLFYKMKQSAYKFSFLLVPLSLPFVWLLFPFRRSAHLYDHVVFTLYSLSFVTLLFVIAALLTTAGLITGQNAAALCVFVPPVHIFAQLKGAYGLSTFGALVRTILLSFFAIHVLAAFFVIVVLLGVV